MWSKLLDDAINEIAKLPGIGRKTAMRLALHLLKQETSQVEAFTSAISRLRSQTQYCKHCHAVSDTDICAICANPLRDPTCICVVEDIRDVMAIENTAQYKGHYHVLNGIISPMEGIGIHDLNIQTLLDKVQQGNIREVIMALPTTMEGDTTNYYIYKHIKEHPVVVTAIARGIAVGDNLEYTDEITLGRSIINRTPYEQVFKL